MRPSQRGVSFQTLPGEPHALQVTCLLCGTFILNSTDALAEFQKLKKELRSPLSCATRQASDSGQPLRLTSANVESFANGHNRSRVLDNLDRLLRITADRAVRPNGAALFCPENDFTLIDCYSVDEFRWYVHWLTSDGLLAVAPAPANKVQLTLLLPGWNRIQPLVPQEGRQGQCFVAMWFSPDVQLAYEAGIAPAIVDAGFRPIRLDEKEYNNDIGDEIIAAIRNSEFVVADFTGQRPNVYYEAGFARGLGRRVIWTCHAEQIEDLHFDTSHQNYIAWNSHDELRVRLFNRIRATILSPK